MLVIFRIQLKVEPYKNNDNNSIEIWATIAGALTLYSSLLFIDDDEESVSGINISVLVLLLVINITFILKWVYLFLESKNIKNATFQKFLKVYATFVCFKSKTPVNSENKETKKKPNKPSNRKPVSLKGKLILNINICL